jgi:hypothetical protein
LPVTLLDMRQRDALDTASIAAAALLSPQAELAVSDAVVFARGQRSMVLWPKWINELHAANPLVDAQPAYYRQQGSLVFAHAPDQSSLMHFTRLLLINRRCSTWTLRRWSQRWPGALPKACICRERGIWPMTSG